MSFSLHKRACFFREAKCPIEFAKSWFLCSWSNAHLFWPYLYISLIFLSQLNRNKSGQVGFLHNYFFKLEQIAQKRPKKAQKRPFSEKASDFLSPLLFLKVGKKPTYLGKNPKIVRTIFKNLPNFSKNLKSPLYNFQKWAEIISIFKGLRTNFAKERGREPSFRYPYNRCYIVQDIDLISSASLLHKFGCYFFCCKGYIHPVFKNCSITF